MLWAENDDKGDPLDENHTIADLPPETVKQAADDCEKFQRENSCTLGRAGYGLADYIDTEMAGHDFWLTRNGHGSGFWDGDLPEEVGRVLTEAAEAYEECSPYVGDDGKVYL